jgi:hypothetical protein
MQHGGGVSIGVSVQVRGVPSVTTSHPRLPGVVSHSSLPFTGANVEALVLAAVVLLVVGVLFVTAALRLHAHPL